MDKYKNLKILILGGAKSGLAVAKIIAKNNDVTLTDMKEQKEEDKKILDELGVKVVITQNQIDLIDSSWDLIIKNPAIMYVSPIMEKIRSLNIRVENEMEVGYHFLPKKIKIIGVTGSNGKTTTVTMINDLLKLSGVKTVLCGNIGTPLCDMIKDIKEDTTLVMEISDHQLLDFHDFKTNISVLTNISPTHLDYHGTYEHYKNTKRNIFNNHTKDDLAITNYTNEDAMEVSKNIPSKKYYFNGKDACLKDDYIYIHDKQILNIKDIKLVGNHNYENIMAALLVLYEFDPELKVASDYFKKFNGVEHRLEYVRTLNGVIYYNDSKATNPVATIQALKTFKEPIRLILGGMERYQDFNDLNDYMKGVTKIYAIGTVTDRVYDYALSQKIDCTKCTTLDKALESIKKDVNKGDVVLLSTASSSQDQYARFEDRGDEFKRIVNSY